MTERKTALSLNRKSFVTSVLMLGMLMAVTGLLTVYLPSSQFERVLVDGLEMIVLDSFQWVIKPDYPVYRWLSAPLEVLWSQDAPVVVVVMIFILLVGAGFSLLEKSGLLNHALMKVVNRFKHQKYQLMAGIILFFMLFGSVFGMFEELIILVPIAIQLSLALGWDRLLGIGISALAAGFGFSAAIFNPFTVGIAQQLAGLPLFSGLAYRVLIFTVYYLLLLIFLWRYAKRIDKKIAVNVNQSNQEVLSDQKALNIFFLVLVMMLGLIVLSFVLPGLSDLLMPLLALVFSLGSFMAVYLTGYAPIKTMIKDWVHGLLAIAPSIVLILMAMSIKLIASKAMVMDTLLFYGIRHLEAVGPLMAGNLLYGIVLFFEFFIGSASAKAFLLMPMVIPMTDVIGLSRQAAVLAFCFADGFSNMLFPTNAALMMILGLSGVSYLQWFKWIVRLLLVAFALSIVFLGFAIQFNYGPF